MTQQAYGVSTGEGGQITIGVSYETAMRVAQRHANGTGEPMFVWPVGEAGGPDEERVDPDVTVRDYDTAEDLDGTASPELVDESREAGDTGAVPAYRVQPGAELVLKAKGKVDAQLKFKKHGSHLLLEHEGQFVMYVP